MTAVPTDPPVRSRPAVRRRTATARRPSPLARAVEGTAARLDGLHAGLDHAARTTLDRALRGALARHVARAGEDAAGVAAVRVACAHLAAGDIEGAYLALLTARDQLG